jgi:hypothetical protein
MDLVGARVGVHYRYAMLHCHRRESVPEADQDVRVKESRVRATAWFLLANARAIWLK